VGTLDIAFVGVEPHFAVAQRAQTPALFVESVGDQLHLVEPVRPPVALLHRRVHPFGDLAERVGEAELIVFGDVLVAEQQNRVFVPRLADLPGDLRRRLPAQVDAADFRPDGRRQGRDGDVVAGFQRGRHVTLSSQGARPG